MLSFYAIKYWNGLKAENKGIFYKQLKEKIKKKALLINI